MGPRVVQARPGFSRSNHGAGPLDETWEKARLCDGAGRQLPSKAVGPCMIRKVGRLLGHQAPPPVGRTFGALSLKSKARRQVGLVCPCRGCFSWLANSPSWYRGVFISATWLLYPNVKQPPSDRFPVLTLLQATVPHVPLGWEKRNGSRAKDPHM
ncbi:hypothetical protein Micbo1qcDRAFT_175361 [Microdochium bolleyi]|uniref:Uncharacterized protein n=1 Tax=Microdochium bolleyi TaxID=196109 RepID=A0A136J5F6_9PEZI|nr:hypothetical protein Micbo1qcDRAFT_175361 [Microdochium bolleyi]